MIIKNKQKLSEAPDKKRGDTCAKKRNRLDKRMTTLKSLLLVVEGAMRPSLDDPLTKFSTSGSCLFY